MTGTLSLDERRTARLMFGAELAAGDVDERTLLESEPVRAAVRDRGVPFLPSRLAHAALRRSGRRDFERDATAAAAGARRAVLGSSGARPPRVLVRMDEYPHWLAEREGPRFDDAAFAPWHEILAGAGCPHLIAVVPRVADDPETRDGAARDLSDVEVRRLAALADDGVEFGLHGYEHRTRFRNPRLHTELGHRPRREVGDLLDRALETLRERTGLQPRVLVPPFNTFGARQFPEFATRFRVVTGGPESVLRLGFHAGPTWRGDAVYLPAYPPLYGTAADVLPEVERRIEDETGLWTPVVLHWGWEAERGWKDLIRLVDAVAPYATRWSEFLDAVEMSR